MLSKCMTILRRAERLVWGFSFLENSVFQKKCYLTPFKVIKLLTVSKLIVDPALFQSPGLQSP